METQKVIEFRFDAQAMRNELEIVIGECKVGKQEFLVFLLEMADLELQRIADEEIQPIIKIPITR